MTVYIVLKNGKVDEVFTNLAAAQNHAKNLNKKWSSTEIVERQLKDL